ncbi:MAG: hypothetical protein V4724_05985 [Pseudomonadota bacterium]
MEISFKTPVVSACFRIALTAFAATLIAAVPAPGQTAYAAAPERLSWYGDPKAPDLSGVWVRQEQRARPVAALASKEGWLPWPPPLKAPFDAAWEKRVAEAAEGKRSDDPVRACLPPGMPRFVSGTNGPMLILQTPGRVMLYRDSAPVRRVWLDASVLPKPEDLENFSNGNAIGRYEGADLVSEVVGLKDLPIDATGVPHSDDLKIVERYHRVDAKTLRVTITLTDPTAYSAPMSTTVTYKAWHDPLWEPREFLCIPERDYHPDLYVR